MRRGISLWVMGGILVASGPLAAQEQPEGKRITVNAAGEVVAKPDVAYLTLEVLGQGKTPAEAQQENDQKAQAVRTALTNAGAAPEAIQLSRFTISPVASNFGGRVNPPRTMGYQVVKSLTVTVAPLDEAALDKLTALVGAATEAGATVVTTAGRGYAGPAAPYGGNTFVQFGLVDDTALRLEALKKAVASARPQAAAVAAALGVQLGDVESVYIAPNYAETRFREGEGTSGVWSDLVIRAAVTVSYGYGGG